MCGSVVPSARVPGPGPLPVLLSSLQASVAHHSPQLSSFSSQNCVGKKKASAWTRPGQKAPSAARPAARGAGEPAPRSGTGPPPPDPKPAAARVRLPPGLARPDAPIAFRITTLTHGPSRRHRRVTERGRIHKEVCFRLITGLQCGEKQFRRINRAVNQRFGLLVQRLCQRDCYRNRCF